ncbi:MAG: twin-arginine translocase subunit TatB [Caulobacteraceae bacterium]|nr:twin-arginine translocase subunit TatB [Caulobacteraceae bacterium]
MFPEGRILDFLIVGAVALIVVGPKDLPVLMRRLGRFLAHMRGLAAEFRASFDEMARQSELDELRKEVEAMKAANPLHEARLMVDDPTRDLLAGIHADLRAPIAPAAPALLEPEPEVPVASPVAEPETLELPLAESAPPVQAR